MDFLDNHQAWEIDFEDGKKAPDNGVFGDDNARMIEGAVSQTIVRAIRDATQTLDPARQQEAASWLMICCPDIAEQVDLPDINFERMSTLAAAYVTVEGSIAA